MKDLIIDCFAGGGGASVGIEMALGRPVDIAINHDPDAILMHKTNHPDTLHLTEDIFKVDLKKYVGNQHVALMWASPDCFPAGNLVWTAEGYKNIEDVECKDYVLTHKGNYKRVYRTIKKNDRKFCNIRIAGCEEFQATLNHPFYARKKQLKCVHGEHRTTITELLEPEWVKAEELTTNYRVGIPINTESIIPKWDGIIKYTYNQYGKTRSEIVNTLDKYMDNPDFWWLIGRYMGDGSVNMDKYTVDLCCAYDDIEEIRPVVDRLAIKYTTREKQSTFSFLFSSKEFCEFVARYGIGSLNKQITPEILNLPIGLLKMFLLGYISADGNVEQTKTNKRYQITTVSRRLAYGLQQCLLKAYGRYAGMTRLKNRSYIQGRKIVANDIYSLVFYENKTNRLQYKIENNMVWVNVKKCEIVNDSQKSVYTLSVEDDESFTVNNISVHNCTSHSKAKGGKPREKGLRILPWAVYKHAKAILPDVILMENVEEIQQWGPLDEKGYPIPERKGEDYQKFIMAMKSLGYIFDCRELVAADYGAPTTRKRWYAIFRRDGRDIKWPVQTHSKDGGDGLKKWIPVSSILNFEDLGKSIFGRKKPLAKNTMNRTAKGLYKFVFNNPEPYIVQVNHGGDNLRGQSINEPMPTITAKHGFGVITPYIIQYHSETTKAGVRGQNVADPLQTIDTSNRYGLVAAFLEKFYKSGTGQSLNEPLHTITTSPGHFGQISVLAVKWEELKKAGINQDVAQKATWVSQFIMEYYGCGTGQTITEPLHTIVTKDRFALITILGDEYAILDIYLRMLQPEELKLAQGFPKDYIIDRDYNWKSYPKAKQVARIGNSVVPIMAQQLVEANCPYLKVGERMPNLQIDDTQEQLRFA